MTVPLITPTSLRRTWYPTHHRWRIPHDAPAHRTILSPALTTPPERNN